MKGQKGFAVLYFVAFLPLLLAVGFCLYVFLSFSDTHLETTQTCLRDQIKIQKNVKLALRQLFKLNPRANSLRAQYRLAQLRLAAAIASGNVPAAALARWQLSQVYQQRGLLDLQQKALILTANEQIANDQMILKQRISQIGVRRENDFKNSMINKIEGLEYKKTRLAVVASDQDRAPSYSLSPHFIEDQALEFKWKLNLVSQNAVARFLPYQSQFPQSCSTTINPKEDSWPTITREVKSSWKRRS